MKINAQFDQPVVLLPKDMKWVASPSPGVERKMLDRVGGEVARATSLVRYAPGSYFDPHVHSGGEEFLVIEGVFSDEHCDYPAGTYVRNPIGTKHKPHSQNGCIIFVKLHQFDPADTAHFSVHLDNLQFEDGGAPGVEFAWLHRFEGEDVKIVRWAPGSSYPTHVHDGGAENFIFEGSLSDEHGHYPKGSWDRTPPGWKHTPYTNEGCLTWTKTGHLTPEKLGIFRAPTQKSLN
ncbi:cupin [Parasphingorhabdus halotolerans]|uniref:Cupin n=2 Tax=Parasphingorhabdus halotolerans TaxID=2725558 RepID=A0A6H2DQ93_9SPHN|nr:cupin [Parasphingorhabdus halotolerans]